MTHIRTQIRHRMIDALEAALPSNYVIFGSRHFARNHTADKIVVDVKCLNDQTQVRETTGLNRIHIASIYIRVQRSADEESLDDSLDADEVLIVGAVADMEWSDLLEEEPELLQVNFAKGEDTSDAIGGMILRFDCEYRINMFNPETPVP